MNKVTTAAGLLSVVIAASALAEPADDQIDVESIEEILVLGRTVDLNTTTIDVETEMVTDTAHVLRRLPGSDFNANGPITGIAQHRGMFGDRVSVALDGVGLISGGPNAMDTPLAYSTPMLTDHIIVERGIPGVGVGPETIGGHISTSLARGDFSESSAFGTAGFVGTRYSDNGDASSTAARLSAVNDHHRVSLLAGIDRGDHLTTPVGDIIPSELSRDRFDLSYGYRNGATELTLFAGLLETTDAGTPALAMDIRSIDTALYGLRYQARPGDKFSLQARLSYNDVEHWMDNFSLRPPPGMAGMYRQNFTTGKGGEYGIAGTGEFDRGDLTFGVDGRVAAHTSDISNPNNPMFGIANFNDVDRDLVGIFTEWQQSLGEGEIELGARFNRVTASAGDVQATGMMGMMDANAQLLADAFNMADRDIRYDNVDVVVKYQHPIGERSTVLVEAGSKTRAPSYQELFLWLPLQATGGLADGRSYIGNLSLKAERSNEINVGFDTSKGRWQVSPHVFYKDVDNFIQGTPSTNDPANMLAMMMSGQGALAFSNVDARIYGADIAWSLVAGDRVTLDGVVSYARGERKDVDDNLYRLAPLNGSIGANYANARWIMRAELAAYARQDKVSAYNNESETPGYGIVNLQFNWQPLESLRLELQASNILDKTFQNHLSGTNRVNDVDIPAGVRLFGRGRTITAGVHFTF